MSRRNSSINGPVLKAPDVTVGSPFGPRPSKLPTAGHDGLHLVVLNRQGVPVPSPLRYCWCMCPRCFMRTANAATGKPTGRCICTLCTCHQ